MHEAVRCTSETQFQESVRKALTLLAGDQAKTKYIEGLLGSKPKWAECFRQSAVLRQIRTTQRIEATYSRWKDSCANGGFGVSTKLYPVDLAVRLARFFDCELSEANHQTQEPNSAFFTSKGLGYLDKLPPSLHKLCRDEYNSALEHFTKQGSGNSESADHAMSTSILGSGSLLSMKGQKCSCRFFKCWGVPCRHMFLGALRMSDPALLHANNLVESAKPVPAHTYEPDTYAETAESTDTGSCDETEESTDPGSCDKRIALDCLQEIVRISENNMLDFMESDGHLSFDHLSSAKDLLDFTKYLLRLLKRCLDSKAKLDNEDISDIFDDISNRATLLQHKWERQRSRTQPIGTNKTS